MKELKILITNDDGIAADGIRRLAMAARKYGQVWVVAPDSERSAMSHAITLRKSRGNRFPRLCFYGSIILLSASRDRPVRSAEWHGTQTVYRAGDRPVCW